MANCWSVDDWSKGLNSDLFSNNHMTIIHFWNIIKQFYLCSFVMRMVDSVSHEPRFPRLSPTQWIKPDWRRNVTRTRTLHTSFSAHTAPGRSPGLAPLPDISWPTPDRSRLNVRAVPSRFPPSPTGSVTWYGNTDWTCWTPCHDRRWTGRISATSVCSAHSPLKVS